MVDLNNQHILILGLGASGLAMARWCAAQGAYVTVADTRSEPPQAAALLRDVPQARFIGGPLEAVLLQSKLQVFGGKPVVAVFKSPGLTPAAVAPVFEAAHTSGVAAGGELSLFAGALQSLKAQQGYAPQVLAVTGTNGKTTVTSLTALLVQRAGLSVALAGNIGPSLLDTLAAHLARGDLPQVWVLELSSFQLEDAVQGQSVDGFDPLAACILNITQDHLDWHGSMSAYAAAKQKIFGPRTQRVLNRSDTVLQSLLVAPAGLGKSQRGRAAASAAPVCVRFGSDMPQHAGDFGLAVVNGVRWLVRAHPLDETPRQRRQTTEELQIQHLMPADALRIRGTHNALNALAALALASTTGSALAPMLHALRDYRGEPHRVELVAVVADVQYVDDSKGTNVGATVAALQGLGEGQKLIPILGGDGKGQDFSPLAEPVVRHARAVVLIGRDAPLIRAALTHTAVPLHDATNMEDAVKQAASLARTGDAVLLSPACASFDMFRDYEHRAHAFRAAVAELAREMAQPLEGVL
ncbi:MAG: UDP-N-acetylmuramoyl-L-alanine--D-glutamate ligase [Burkholderiales bacterium]